MRGAERGEGNVYLESVGFVLADPSSPTATQTQTQTPKTPLTLTGTLLVRNVTYQKTVAVRFTLDEWHTTSEVLAKHERSLASLPSSFTAREDRRVCSPYALDNTTAFRAGEGEVPAWDRFRFEVSLEDYASSGTLAGRCRSGGIIMEDGIIGLGLGRLRGRRGSWVRVRRCISSIRGVLFSARLVRLPSCLCL
ncbi:hypothetical protein GALMADRAFT_401101 [Galerina marginata CBS 339.88]|uniref:CBM21 domain-containing protein n=1 Tax=Galerina marginata (strain CBS 339.88) TaxID=685588 RepID=A0A067U1B6_GALM3|nr:hypothetical protein GALMADRAFT_401101 [Galerina marginata CBS 339.88]